MRPCDPSQLRSIPPARRSARCRHCCAAHRRRRNAPRKRSAIAATSSPFRHIGGIRHALPPSAAMISCVSRAAARLASAVKSARPPAHIAQRRPCRCQNPGRPNRRRSRCAIFPASVASLSRLRAQADFRHGEQKRVQRQAGIDVLLDQLHRPRQCAHHGPHAGRAHALRNGLHTSLFDRYCATCRPACRRASGRHRARTAATHRAAALISPPSALRQFFRKCKAFAGAGRQQRAQRVQPFGARFKQRRLRQCGKCPAHAAARQARQLRRALRRQTAAEQRSAHIGDRRRTQI